VQLDHVACAGGLMQAVDVLRDDTAEVATGLEGRHRSVAVVRQRPGDRAPAEVAARPVPLPAGLARDEVAVCHRRVRPEAAGLAAVVRDPRLGGDARTGEYDDIAGGNHVRQRCDVRRTRLERQHVRAGNPLQCRTRTHLSRVTRVLDG
jgi:hypothetical protein